MKTVRGEGKGEKKVGIRQSIVSSKSQKLFHRPHPGSTWLVCPSNVTPSSLHPLYTFFKCFSLPTFSNTFGTTRIISVVLNNKEVYHFPISLLFFHP